MSEEHRQDNVDRIDVPYVAHLARLRLSEEETRRFQEQLEDIVGYVRKIRALDLAGVEPMSRAVAGRNVFRDDTVQTGLDRETALANAPVRLQDLFGVPRIME